MSRIRDRGAGLALAAVLIASGLAPGCTREAPEGYAYRGDGTTDLVPIAVAPDGGSLCPISPECEGEATGCYLRSDSVCGCLTDDHCDDPDGLRTQCVIPFGSEGYCVQCTSDAACSGDTPSCDLDPSSATAGLCVAG